MKEDQSVDPLFREVLTYRKTGRVLQLGPDAGGDWLANQGFDVSLLKEPQDAATLQPGDRFDLIMSICAFHLMPLDRLASLVHVLQQHITPNGLHAFKALGHQEPQATAPRKTTPVPWLAWYSNWNILRYEYRDSPQPSKFALSDRWLYDHVTVLIARPDDRD
jgi:hypothetical protein